MEWNMEENFSMEWKVFSMECKWNGIVIVITFYSPSWLGQDRDGNRSGRPAGRVEILRPAGQAGWKTGQILVSGN